MIRPSGGAIAADPIHVQGTNSGYEIIQGVQRQGVKLGADHQTERTHSSSRRGSRGGWKWDLQGRLYQARFVGVQRTAVLAGRQEHVLVLEVRIDLAVSNRPRDYKKSHKG